MSAREANKACGLMIDTARAEPAPIEKHGRGVVMVSAVEEDERLRGEANAVPRRYDGADPRRSANRERTERA
jgi:hypothetical protein